MFLHTLSGQGQLHACRYQQRDPAKFQPYAPRERIELNLRKTGKARLWEMVDAFESHSDAIESVSRHVGVHRPIGAGVDKDGHRRTGNPGGGAGYAEAEHCCRDILVPSDSFDERLMESLPLTFTPLARRLWGMTSGYGIRRGKS